ncbi:MAG: class I poly(R)-hydroxyalkanoic acid synthase [Proteobacteria bacterium]|nr:class I poly(R)-hydroxyalkanoic acid synthase [Pseudomonadota bacterium]
MTHDTELSELMQSVAKKSLQIIAELKDKPTPLPVLINQFIDLTEHFQHLINIILKNPEKVIKTQISYWEDAVGLAQSMLNSWVEGTPMPINDHRFSGDDWMHNPFFNFLSQQYLLASEHLNSMLENVEYSDKNAAKRLQFFTKQYLDALSPANFIHTNPQIITETIESSGKNLLKGLHNLLSDLEADSLRLSVKMTDTDAFEIGKNLAITPGKVIFRNEMIELIQYTPQTEKVNSVPLLMIPPWINKYYILDLSPHNSLIRWLVSQGITVFIISWVNPDKHFAQKSLFDYLQEGPKAAINTIKKQLNVKKVNTLGFCIGGTLLTNLLAYDKAHKDKSINSATLLAALIDFSDPGDISVFIDEQQILQLEAEMRDKGFLDGRFMATTFNSLRANDLVWSFFIKNYLRGKNPVPFDILYWNADVTNMPELMHSEYLRWMYLHNNLIKPGKIRLNKTPLDITKIDTETYFISTEKDHIAPWQTTYIGFQAMAGKKHFLLGGSGHIAGIINPPSTKKYHYYVNKKTNLSTKEWLEQAKKVEGSWWPEWMAWLTKTSGKDIPAPVISKLPMKVLAKAPGEYVRKTYLSKQEKEEKKPL